MTRLGILASHPVQYYAPWFRALARRFDVHVFFAHRPNAQQQALGFGGQFEWDIDLLSGYQSHFLPNVAANPGPNHFFGCDTPAVQHEIEARQFTAFIVSGWNLKTYWQAVRACRRLGTPVFVRGDSQLDPTSPLLRRTLKQVSHRVALRHFDGFLSVGKRNRNYLRHYRVPERKIFFVPHFVDNERFATQAKEIRNQRAEIRRRWNIREHAFCILFCGKFIPKKRPLDLVRAARHLKQVHGDSKIHLLFVGRGELGTELRANCDVVFDSESDELSGVALPGQKYKPKASFAGFLNQTQISRAYVAADCLVLPSDYGETWGLVVNEGMACGLPAIVSDAVGCGPDLIDAGQTGYTSRVGDLPNLAEQIYKAATNLQAGFDFKQYIHSKLRIFSLDTAVENTASAITNGRT